MLRYREEALEMSVGTAHIGKRMGDVLNAYILRSRSEGRKEVLVYGKNTVRPFHLFLL